MDCSNFWLITLLVFLYTIQNSVGSETGENKQIEQISKRTKQDLNPLGTLILNHSAADSVSDKHEPTNESLTRVKRQYGRRYPYPPVIIFGVGGFGPGFGRGFGGRGFGGGRGGFGGARGGFGGRGGRG